MQDFSPSEGKEKKQSNSRLRRFDLGLLLISFFSAVALWFFITGYQDPEAVLTIEDVSVRLLHEDRIEQEGKVCTVMDGTDTIPVVTVTASRSVVDALERDNIIATADLLRITERGLVPIELSTNKYSDSITSISGSIRFVHVSVENRVSESLTLEASTRGKVADGYLLTSVTTDQNQVRVTGPESVVESIASAGVTVDVTGATSTISTNAEIHLYDKDGDDIEIGGNLTLNNDKVVVKAEILPTKELTINAAASGKPANGYRLSGEYMIEPGTVLVAGRRSVLENLKEIVIPSAALDVTGLNSNLTKTFNLRNYLPEGTILVDEDSTVRVTVEIVQIPKERIEAPTPTPTPTPTPVPTPTPTPAPTVNESAESSGEGE